MTDVLVIGAGPAGLMATETLAAAGRKVTIVDAMPSVGRKFMMAGKSGLNITKDEDIDTFLSACGPMPEVMQTALRAFGPEQVKAWAEGLGQPLFTGSTGRVFPKAMKASPLLRAWMGRLTDLGVAFHTRWRWTGWDDEAVTFDTQDGPQRLNPAVTILGLGGASWPRLGSDGTWSKHFDQIAPFQPANMGFLVQWSEHMAGHFGKPVKAVALNAGQTSSRGEFVISAHGIEGGGIYEVSRAMREGASLTIDLLPDWSLDRVRKAVQRPRGKNTLTNHLRKALKLEPAQLAILSEFGRPFPQDIASIIKSVPITHSGPMSLEHAISSAGGIRFEDLQRFQMRDRTNVYCVGEMLNWEAPTGGYLITACLATGRAAALQALVQ